MKIGILIQIADSKSLVFVESGKSQVALLAITSFIF